MHLRETLHLAPRPKPTPPQGYGVILASSAETRYTLRDVMERVPLRMFAKGRLTEGDLALATATPILGQYAPQFGWPDDWGLYWEYLDGYLFIPEVAWAIKTKTRLIFKPGYTIDADPDARDFLEAEFKRLKLIQRFKGACKNALIWGNAYLETVDDSEAVWSEPTMPSQAVGVLGTRVLQSWKPATGLYGLKPVDPRTVRVVINPFAFDPTRGEVSVTKYIQRVWQGPLGPTSAGIWSSNQEIDLHPEQVLHLRFNKLPDGIYGYSMYRETVYVLKGYMVMLQFLPGIVQKRSDPLLHFKQGGNVKTIDGVEQTEYLRGEDFIKWQSTIQNRQPGEDVFSDVLTSVEEVFKGASGPLAGIEQFIQIWKERVLMGLGIPQTMVDVLKPGGEIKWGELKFEVLEDEIREYQEAVEDLLNDRIIPRLLAASKFAGAKVVFKFNPITPEDWRASTSPLIDLKNAGVVGPIYIRKKLNIPEDAGDDATPQQQNPPKNPPEPLPGRPSGVLS